LAAVKPPRIVYQVALAMLAVSAVVTLFSHVVESFRAQSPGGAYTVVARTQPFRFFIGVMPGQGGDKPALVSLYKGMQLCGSASAERVSMARDMQWDMDARPRRLAIKFVGDWNLDDCTVIRRSQD
jgi:hypothetical protein